MTIKETAKYRILANAVQRNFGVTSEIKYPTHFLKANIISDKHIQFICQTTITFGHQSIFLEMRPKYIAECVSLIDQAMTRISEEYAELVKNKEKLLEPKVEPYEKPAPKTIKLKFLSDTLRDDLEYINYTTYDRYRTAYFRVIALAELV